MIEMLGTTENAYNNPSSWQVTLPEQPMIGDVAIVWVYTYNYSKNITVPATFTQLRNQGSNLRGRLCIAYRTLMPDDVSFTFTSTNSYTDSTLIWVLAMYRGIDPENPIDAESGLPVAGSGAPNPPACTSVTDGAVHLGAYGQRNDTTGITAPTNYGVLDYCSSTLGSDAHVGIISRVMTTAGYDDPGTVTTGTTAGWTAHTLALRPAAAGQAYVVDRYPPTVYQASGLYVQGEGGALLVERTPTVHLPTGTGIAYGGANYVEETPAVYQATGIRRAQANYVARTVQVYQAWGGRTGAGEASFVERTPAVYSPAGDEGYNSYLTGLDAGVHYYVRAYATTINGTGYGDEKEFTASGSAVATASFVERTPTIHGAIGSAHIIEVPFVERIPVVYQVGAEQAKFAGLMGMLFNAKLRGLETQYATASYVERTSVVYSASGQAAQANLVEQVSAVYQPSGADTGDNIVIEKNINGAGWNVVYIGPWDSGNPWVDDGPFANGVEYCYRAYRVTNGVASPYSNTDCVTYASAGYGSTVLVASAPTVYQPSGIIGTIYAVANVQGRMPVVFRPTGAGGVVNGTASYVERTAACYEATGVPGLTEVSASYVERAATVYQPGGTTHQYPHHGPPFKTQRNMMTPTITGPMHVEEPKQMAPSSNKDTDEDEGLRRER